VERKKVGMKSTLRTTVVGPGAVGSLLAHGLLSAGIETALLATGRRAREIEAHGLVLVDAEGRDAVVQPRVAVQAEELGQQDVVFLCTKSTALLTLAPCLAALIGPNTTIVSLMNGVPWWFLHGLDGLEGLPDPWHPKSVDPGGTVSKALPPAQCLGCVVHLSSALDARGRVLPGRGRRLIVGAPSRNGSNRVQAVVDLLKSARFDVEFSSDIHREIWAKLWGNLTMNPISALTLATADKILDEPHTRRLIENMMLEAQEVGARLGITLDMSIADRIAVTRQLGAFKTSMLQDVEAGRPLEVDAIIRSVSELARVLGVPAPFIEAILGLIALRAEQNLS
jgi:2-dehydropantoate 2-reductase